MARLVLRFPTLTYNMFRQGSTTTALPAQDTDVTGPGLPAKPKALPGSFADAGKGD